MAKQQEQGPTNLCISNLLLSMEEQEFESVLEPFGQLFLQGHYVIPAAQVMVLALPGLKNAKL
jgi:hypothetical protein